MLRKIIGSLIGLLLLCGCSSDDSFTSYSKYKASFTYSAVMTVTPLKNALNGPGTFCSVSLDLKNHLVFSSLTQTQTVDITASAHYQSFRCLSGFIVGMANTPEIGMDGLSRMCFDLACSNCFHGSSIKRNLQLRENGYAYCDRCKRTYNLNNIGVVHSGDPGRPLERYHVLYDGANNMTITN